MLLWKLFFQSKYGVIKWATHNKCSVIHIDAQYFLLSFKKYMKSKKIRSCVILVSKTNNCIDWFSSIDLIILFFLILNNKQQHKLVVAYRLSFYISVQFVPRFNLLSVVFRIKCLFFDFMYWVLFNYTSRLGVFISLKWVLSGVLYIFYIDGRQEVPYQ